MKILVTGSFQISHEQIDKLSHLGAQVTFHADERAAVENPENYEAVVCNGLFLYHKIEEFTNLRFIQLTSAGFDRVPMDYITAHGIEIANARGVYSVPMAEYALFGVLNLLKQGHFFYENQKDHLWEKHRSLQELCGKTVCILGCGSVGTQCAKRFMAFGCHVIGVDLYPREDANFERIAPLEQLFSCLQKSDVVVLTLPLTKETHHIMNAQAFKNMRRGAILVNIARGAVVDTAAMIDALQKKLGGAVLDVFEEEPLNAQSTLWDMENVLITPHNSFVGENNAERLWNVIFQSFQKLLGEDKR